MFRQTTTFTNVTENGETEDGGELKQATVNMVFDSTEMTYHEMVELERAARLKQEENRKRIFG